MERKKNPKYLQAIDKVHEALQPAANMTYHYLSDEAHTIWKKKMLFSAKLNNK